MSTKKLSKNNQKVIDVLREKKLNYLIVPFKKMIELENAGEINIHKMSWKKIMQTVYQGYKSVIEKEIRAYVIHYGLIAPKRKREDTRISKERVKSYRENKKALGYRQVSIQVSRDDYRRLQAYKEHFGLTYEQAIHKLLAIVKIKESRA